MVFLHTGIKGNGLNSEAVVSNEFQVCCLRNSISIGWGCTMSTKHKHVELIGAACSLGGKHIGCRYGPDVLVRHFSHSHLPLPSWKAIIRESQSHQVHSNAEAVLTFSKRLSDAVLSVCKSRHMPVVIGGDHSSAIGTWTGVSHTQNSSFGMLWVDAHLDSHTPETSHSGAIHGMPLACLLGHGENSLLHLEPRRPVLDPRYTVVVGARCYEKEEIDLLTSLGVKIFTMDDVHHLGLETVLNSAMHRVALCPNGYGISIDLDAFDPKQVSAVSVPVPGGLSFNHFHNFFHRAIRNKKLLGVEIAEFNPTFDATGRTSDLIQSLIEQLCDVDQFKAA